MKTLIIAQSKHRENSLLIHRTSEIVSQFACDTNPLNNIALSRYVEFLLQANLVTLEKALTISSNEEVYHIIHSNYKSVQVLKRSCVFKLGELTLLANQYGVLMYFLNKDYPIEGFMCQESPWCSRIILDVLCTLGTHTDRFIGKERVYNYLSLKNTHLLCA